MKLFRKKPTLRLSLLTAMILVFGVAVTLKYVARAQDSGASTTDLDIGVAPVAGGVQSSGNGTYAITSSGAGTSGTNDAFNYLYQTLGTNGQMVVQVAAIQSVGGYGAAGVMIRETLGAGSRNAMVLMTLGQGSSFQWRAETGGNSHQTAGITNATTPCWLKIVRNGDWVGGYESADGTNWTLVDWQTFTNLAEQVYVGLAVTGDNTQEVSATATFDEMSIGTADLSQVTLPVIGNGDGLLGSYFDNRHLYGEPVTNRVDDQLDFDFWALTYGNATSAADYTNLCQSLLGMPKSDEFGVRWVGEVQAQYTEAYTLYVKSDDGVRVWLNEQLIIDDWQCQSLKESSATVNLTAGQKYLLRVEYFQNHGGASIKLRWSSPSTPKRVIPQSQLYSRPTMDANGLPIHWEEHYFGQTNVDPNGDPDGDGFSNLQEWEQHSDPTDPLDNWNMPSPWGHGDIDESGGSKGNAGYSNGIFTASSFGEIFQKQDSFHYVYRPLGTNGELVARVLDISGPNGASEAGVMIRENLDNDARNGAMFLTASNGLAFQWRAGNGWGTTTTRRLPKAAGPYWLKVVRKGDWVGGFASPDGTNWTLINWQVLPGLASRIFVGMAVTACNADHQLPTNSATAQFDNVGVSPAPPSDVLNPVEGTGDGLTGSYCDSSLLYLPGITNCVDPQVNFAWVHEPPFNGLDPNGYGVCWSGEVQAQFTEPYTFSVVTRREDWVRVWVNEKLVINQWRTLHLDGDFKGTPVSFVAGQHYLIRVEVYNNLGKAKAVLNWSSPSTSERLILQSQLYSQPQMDPDGSGLPVIWEQIYFGQAGVDPNGDPDNDGLSNLQEWKYHTNPTNSDTDGDGLPDAWEIANGTDPQYPDSDLDYNNSGLSNLQDYQLGLNPFNVDMNNDGLPDWFEEEYLGTGPSLVCTDQISVAVSVNGSQATNYLGNWQADGTDIFCLERRGGVDFNLSLSNADKYVLNLIGTQNVPNPMATSFSLLLGIDNQSLEHYTLNAGYGTNGRVELVLPYLQAGSHTLHVFWDGAASGSSLRIKQVKLLAVSGPANKDGIKTWAAQMIADESGMDNTNDIIASYTSPVCLEGRDPFPTMMAMTNSQTNVLSVRATSDDRWYVNVPLSPESQTDFQATYQNGALTQSAKIQWMPINLLTATNLMIRKGDSLLFNALPTNNVNGQLQVVVGSNTYSSQTTNPVPYFFTNAGNYTVIGTYTSESGQSQSGSITVDVVEQHLPHIQPAAWVGMERTLNLTNLAPEAVLQADSRLTCYISGTNATGGAQLTLGIDANEPRTILARLGANGPVLDSTQVQGFNLWSGNQAYTEVMQVYPDGSQLVQMLVISSPVETNVTFVIQPIVSGVVFDDGTILKTLTATNFDALNQCPVRFIRAASATTSVCNEIRGYQGNYQIGYRH